MARLIFAVSVTVAIVTFAMMNTHQVTLSFIFGQPVKVRLIFLLMSTFMMGMIFLGLFMMIWRVKGRPRPPRIDKPQQSPADLVEE
jgi:uncharacterized integral membrane protein